MDDLNIQETIMQKPAKKAVFLKVPLIIVSAVLGITSLSVGGYFAYQIVFLSPEKILIRMLEKQNEVKTYSFDSDIRFELKGIDELTAGFTAGITGLPPQQAQPKSEKPSVFVLKSAGAVDGGKDPLFPDSIVSFNLAIDESGKQPELEKKGQPLQTVLLGAEMRAKDKVGYIAIKKAPNLGIINFSALENQWVKFDTQADASKQQVDEFTKQIEEFLPKEKQKELADAFLKKKPFKIKKGKEKVAGVSTHHLIIEVGRDEVKALLELINAVVPEDKRSSEEDLKKAEKDIADLIPADKPLQFHLWIGKRDYHPYQFRFTFEFQKIPDTPVSGSISIRMTVKDINKPVTIEIPQDAKTFEEVFGTLFGAPSAGTPTDSDDDGLSDIDEVYYGSDSQNPDSDGDTYKDGAEVQNGYSPTGPGILTLPPPPSQSSTSSQLGDTRNAQRRSDVHTILNAVYQYTLDNNDKFPSAIKKSPVCSEPANEICKTDAKSCSGLVNLSVLTKDQRYLTSIGVDPQSLAIYDLDYSGTGYNIVTSTNGRLTVCAPQAEGGETISATR
ncbi:MAG: hypothetical protein Q7R79_02320 [bacterium]|nr:hypothetical protein [bacterium]